MIYSSCIMGNAPRFLELEIHQGLKVSSSVVLQIPDEQRCPRLPIVYGFLNVRQLREATVNKHVPLQGHSMLETMLSRERLWIGMVLPAKSWAIVEQSIQRLTCKDIQDVYDAALEYPFNHRIVEMLSCIFYGLWFICYIM